jgi:hypothetical protein
VAQRAAKLFLFDKNFEKVFQFIINLFNLPQSGGKALWAGTKKTN